MKTKEEELNLREVGVGSIGYEMGKQQTLKDVLKIIDKSKGYTYSLFPIGDRDKWINVAELKAQIEKELGEMK